MTTTPIEAVNPLAQKYGYVPGASSGKTGEDNLFVTLLTTQLRNQNPLEPLENGEFIQQMAGMAQVQETQSLSAKIGEMIQIQQVVAGQNAFSQSAALVGETVKYLDSAGKEQTALVEGVTLKDDALTLTVGGEEIPLGSVIGISAPAPAPETDASGDSGDTGGADTNNGNDQEQAQ